jgi:hypothetical protein
MRSCHDTLSLCLSVSLALLRPGPATLPSGHTRRGSTTLPSDVTTPSTAPRARHAITDMRTPMPVVPAGRGDRASAAALRPGRRCGLRARTRLRATRAALQFPHAPAAFARPDASRWNRSGKIRISSQSQRPNRRIGLSSTARRGTDNQRARHVAWPPDAGGWRHAPAGGTGRQGGVHAARAGCLPSCAFADGAG